MLNVTRIFYAFFIILIKLYQWLISPLLPNNCRHVPTCSQYVVESIWIWGPFKGALLGIKRLLRCYPWGTCGYDPVPQKPGKFKEPSILNKGSNDVEAYFQL